jgi:hypothetical protein
VADIWGFAKSTEKLIWLIRRKPQISTTANVRSKFTLRERLQETPKPHSRNLILSPELIEKFQNFLAGQTIDHLSISYLSKKLNPQPG